MISKFPNQKPSPNNQTSLYILDGIVITFNNLQNWKQPEVKMHLPDVIKSQSKD